MLQQKDEAVSKQQRRVIAQLLENGKIESARIRVENVIRSDITVELYEILELYCELLHARTGLLEGPECDTGLEEATKSIIYAAPKTEVKELQQVRALLCERFGKEFALNAMENSDQKVSERVLKKLTVIPPSMGLVNGYLDEIARTYGVNRPKGSQDGLEELPDPSDGPGDCDSGLEKERRELDEKSMTDTLKRKDLSMATPPRDIGPKSPLQVNLPNSKMYNLHPKMKGTSELSILKKSSPDCLRKNETRIVGGSIPDVDELASRFAALKK